MFFFNILQRIKRVRSNIGEVQLDCVACQMPVAVRPEDTRIFVCLEDNWHTCVFTCPRCHCRRSEDVSQEKVTALGDAGVATMFWSVTDAFCPVDVDNARRYTPRRIPSTWLPFDETDAALFASDMNTSNWFTLLEQYDPHGD